MLYYIRFTGLVCALTYVKKRRKIDYRMTIHTAERTYGISIMTKNKTKTKKQNSNSVRNTTDIDFISL